MSPSTKTTAPCQAFLDWQAAIEAAAVLRRQLVGRRVQSISHIRPEYQGPRGEIQGVSARGFEVAWDNTDRPGRTVSSAHPDDVVFI